MTILMSKEPLFTYLYIVETLYFFLISMKNDAFLYYAGSRITLVVYYIVL